MNLNEKIIPQWKAPDTLLCRVMKHVDKCECSHSFFTWPAIQRILFCIASAVAFPACVMISYLFISYPDIMLYINKMNSVAFSVYQEILIAHSVFHQLVREYLMQPAIIGFGIIIGLSIFVAWITSIAVLNKMLQMQVGRKYI